MKKRLIRRHRQKFGRAPTYCVFAPGRINFIGEHTDYSGGLVMPMALSMGIYVAISPNDNGLLRIQSLDFGEYGEFPMDDLHPDAAAVWANCPKGVVRMLLDGGYAISGADLTITGDLPIGAGLSSSAAVEVAVGFAARKLFDVAVGDQDLAALCQKAEHVFTGAQCGIMDQTISILGRRRTLLKLSCADLSYDYIPFTRRGVSILITNSHVAHNLAQGEYNVRRAECARIFKAIRTVNRAAQNISDFTLAEFEKHRRLFKGKLRGRLQHILSENERVKKMEQALKDGDLVAAGRLLYESHASLRDDYEVSCAELDWLVSNAAGIPGVYGSRMTGGGFGGCTITLMRNAAIGSYRASLRKYAGTFGVRPEVYMAVPSDGARVI